MKRLALIIITVIVAATLMCPLCGLMGTMQFGPGGVYYVCPNGHTWK